MAIAQKVEPYFTPEEYLEQERQAKTKSEYFAGQVYAMAGASGAHNIIVANALASLIVGLRGRPCIVYASDMRVKISLAGLYTYPNVSIVCGEAQFDDNQKDTLLNPTVLIEVLSDSTEAYDRGRKFVYKHYHKLDSLAEYLLIDQDHAAIDRYVRQPDDRWLLTAYRGLDAVTVIDAIVCELPLAEVYDKVEGLEDERGQRVLSVVKEQQAPYLTS